MTALRPAIAAKQYGHEDTLASLVADAALSVMPPNPKNFNVDHVRVVKIMGGSLATSKVVQGMVFGREPEGTVFCWCSLYVFALIRRYKAILKKCIRPRSLYLPRHWMSHKPRLRERS